MVNRPGSSKLRKLRKCYQMCHTVSVHQLYGTICLSFSFSSQVCCITVFIPFKFNEAMGTRDIHIKYILLCTNVPKKLKLMIMSNCTKWNYVGLLSGMM